MIAASSLPPTPAAMRKSSDGAVKRVKGSMKKFFARAHSIKGQVQSGAQTVASGTQKVAHGVFTQTKTAADHLQTLSSGLLQERRASKENVEVQLQESDDSAYSSLSSHYLTVRLDRKRRRTEAENEAKAEVFEPLGNRKDEQELWFAVPRSRADAIRNLLLEWAPDPDIKKAAAALQSAARQNDENAASNNNRGLLVVERDGVAIDVHEEDKPATPGWEVVSVRELCRRLSLEEAEELPLPDGARESEILDEFMCRQLIAVLPPRAQHYSWQSIYNSERNGFSLATLYRCMSAWVDELSPILLVVRDTRGHVFGAVASTAPQPRDSYFGTGDSSFLFRFAGEFPNTRELITYTWTGENQFFINATREFLSFGAGGGHYGLYLDADLNHGRSQRCATFNNEPLAGGVKEDFQIQFVEAFGFCVD